MVILSVTKLNSVIILCLCSVAKMMIRRPSATKCTRQNPGEILQILEEITTEILTEIHTGTPTRVLHPSTEAQQITEAQRITEAHQIIQAQRITEVQWITEVHQIIKGTRTELMYTIEGTLRETCITGTGA